MAFKDSFTDDEWAQVAHAPMMAMVAIGAADPGGLLAAAKEGTALALALSHASKDASEGLVHEVAEEIKTTKPGRKQLGIEHPQSREHVEQMATDAIRRAAALVAAKVPAESDGYRAFLMTTSERIANAAKEGGFLGIGGERVSAAEEHALAEIAGALGVTR